MLDQNEQRRVFDLIAQAVAKRGLYVAPVGSLYFMFRGEPKLMTKDVDAVVHGKDFQPVSIETLVDIGQELGEVEVAHDKASVQVTIKEPGREDVLIDLLRGRAGGKGGFLNRDLLASGASEGERNDPVILYPPEYVIILKAEAAVDRAKRAETQNEYTADNKRRAEIFRADVVAQVRTLQAKQALSMKHFRDAIALVKENRRKDIADLLRSASGGAIAIEP